ncbi:hypothetical protein DPMN_188659 [Dreissena polymorpha]|uniref:Uncharacterized protein n=1 Tax=Dreissena polymorpha TaxID=45954 RepID=A0A9D4I8Q7_DREPO|nr:hypothetical protein DPMN_188659 [Dreissena polymorpha]
MTSEEFTDVVSNDNVLTKEETLSVYRTLAEKMNVSKFKKEPRGMACQKYLFVRGLEIGAGDGYTYWGMQDGLTFTVSNECEMTGVDLIIPQIGGTENGVLQIHNSLLLYHTIGCTCMCVCVCVSSYTENV